MHFGLFGGTFDPIHVCHLRIAEQVQAALKLNQIIFLPTGDPPHKKPASLAPAHHRLAMVKIALEAYPTFTVSEVEIRLSGISYTVNTVTSLKQSHPPDTEWSFIVGLDAFLDFPNWKDAPHLLELCHFVVCSRPGSQFGTLASLPGLPPIPPPDLEALDAGHRHRLNISLPTGRQLILLSLPPCDASASTIRQEISHGHSALNWLPPSVESYIIEHCLY